MTRSLLSGGVIAGAITGLAVAFLQFFLIQPLIIEAESDTRPVSRCP